MGTIRFRVGAELNEVVAIKRKNRYGNINIVSADIMQSINQEKNH